MPVWNTYSHRKRVRERDVPDVYVHDELPERLRVQIVQICRAAVGRFQSTSEVVGAYADTNNNRGWSFIHDTVARELGMFELSSRYDVDDKCAEFIHQHDDVDEVLDLVEVAFHHIDRHVRKFMDHECAQRRITQTTDSAIEELNERFRRAGVGYSFEGGQILRIDSELVHNEIVRPALWYLNHSGFEGPRDEFLRAHGHYRAGEAKDAIIDANNAFESTLKVICDKRGWEYSAGATASILVKVVKQNGLFPDYLEKSFEQLAATLQSGLPKVRAEEAAHGQGGMPRQTPDYVASYALHLAAANILFLAEADHAMP